MNDYILATVSTSDLPRKWLEDHDIPFVSYTLVIDDMIYEDDCREETRQTVFSAMREGKMPSTSQIPEFTYEQFFRRLLDTGKDVCSWTWPGRCPLPLQTAKKRYAVPRKTIRRSASYSLIQHASPAVLPFSS